MNYNLPAQITYIGHPDQLPPIKQCERSEQQPMHPVEQITYIGHSVSIVAASEGPRKYRPIPTPPIRETFGIIDRKTMKPYADLIEYSIEKDTFSPNNLLQFYYFNRGIKYYLQMDAKLIKALVNWKLVRVIISLQQRTDGNIALARILKESNKEKEGE